MKTLLDITNTKTRLLQHALMGVCGLLVGMGFTAFWRDTLPQALAVLIIAVAGLLLIVTARIKQRWEIEHRGHRIRFENSVLTAEKLFLDEGLVARGGVGKKRN